MKFSSTPRVIRVLPVIFIIVFFSSAYPQANHENKPMKMLCEVTGKGPPLVLVPGGLTGWASWEPFVKIFSEKRTVIRVQLLGVQLGLENTPLPSGYSVKTESEALMAILDSLGYDMPVHMVGWSFGGFTALDFSLDHPERIRTLTLIEPPAMWVLRATNNFNQEHARLADLFNRFRGEISEEMLAGFLAAAGFTAPGQNVRELPQWNSWLPFRQSLRMNPAVAIHRDEIDRLKTLRSPVLLIKGTGSAPWLHRVIDVLSQHLPHSRTAEFPGGHAPHIVSREKFLPELEAFQNSLKH